MTPDAVSVNSELPVLIFIADDNAIDRTILASALQNIGLAVTSFSSGNAVLEAMSSAANPVVLLLDWVMPGCSGIDVCKELSENPPVNGIYIIMVTGRSNKSDIAFALDNGADEIIAKPFDITELRARINVGMRLVAARRQMHENNCKLIECTQQAGLLAKERTELLMRIDSLSAASRDMFDEINTPAAFITAGIRSIEENLPKLSVAIHTNASVENIEKAQAFIQYIPEILGDMKAALSRIDIILNRLKNAAS